jgi:acyl-CoA reductase-like NAD-dependent aldehyde dehydrogenase
VTGDPCAVAAVDRARAAFGAWGRLSHQDRRPYLDALRRTLARHADEIADVVTAETGKPRTDVLQAEVLHAVIFTRYCAQHAGRVLGPRRVPSWPLVTKRAWLAYRPYGVAAVITPWNHPFLLPCLAAVSALAAGCTAVIKPSERTPDSARLLAELVQRAGFPDDVVVLLRGGADTGVALLRAGPDVVAFTGSSATGRRVAAVAAETLTPVMAELGGKDAMLVLDDADLRRAARAAVWGAFFNAGQNCVSIERVYVRAEVYDAFVAEVDEAMSGVSAGGNWRTDIGPIIDARRVTEIGGQLADATDGGARVRRGGQWSMRAGRRYLAPTLLTDVTADMLVMREETGAPVLPVMAVADDYEAVDRANDSPFGLQASIWTSDLARARRLAARLRVGGVAINDCLVNYAVPALPFGGVGASGTGRQGGPDGLRQYCYPQTTTAGRFDLPREPQWFPRVGGPRLWRTLVRLLGR